MLLTNENVCNATFPDIVLLVEDDDAHNADLIAGS